MITLISSNEELPDFEEGYYTWKEAFDSGKAGVFTIDVSAAVKFVEEAMNQ